MYFQPKMDTDTLDLIGAEALVRWKKPDGRFIYPDEFIPLIERSGQIVDVDYYVYREVFRFLAERIKEGKKVVPISLNVSRMHLNRTDFLTYVESLLKEFQIPCSRSEQHTAELQSQSGLAYARFGG